MRNIKGRITRRFAPGAKRGLRVDAATAFERGRIHGRRQVIAEMHGRGGGPNGGRRMVIPLRRSA